MENNKEITIIPLFSSPIFTIKLEEDMESLQRVKTDYFFRNSFAEGNHNTEETSTKVLLEDFQREKEIFLNYFYFIKNEVFHYENDFEITTSWGTKSPTNSFCQFHSHKNSFFSGVFYLDDDDEAGPLEFESFNITSREMFVNTTESNIYNSSSWKIQPSKNLLVFFPSYLHHRIGLSTSKNDRYSIAFNIFPNGKMGAHDSFVDLTINK